MPAARQCCRGTGNNHDNWKRQPNVLHYQLRPVTHVVLQSCSHLQKSAVTSLIAQLRRNHRLLCAAYLLVRSVYRSHASQVFNYFLGVNYGVTLICRCPFQLESHTASCCQWLARRSMSAVDAQWNRSLIVHRSAAGVTVGQPVTTASLKYAKRPRCLKRRLPCVPMTDSRERRVV